MHVSVMSFYEVVLFRAVLCTKVATAWMMTKERSQHKGSCHGNLYRQKCRTDWIKWHFGSAN